MKKKFLGRVLTMLLVASMVFTLLPAPAIAAGNWWWNNDEYTEEAVPTATTDNYDRILHLDCGRKYFTKDWIIALMTEAKAAGYNQVQLAFGNKGLRFLLKDMSVLSYTDKQVRDAIQKGNKAYFDAGTANELTQADMDDILAAAAALELDVIPLFNTPFHMEAVITAMEELEITDSYFTKVDGTPERGCLNLSTEDAVNFVKALMQKYVNYFSGKSCKYFSFGADEYTGGWNDTFYSYAGEIASMIKTVGMTPRVFNDSYRSGSTTYINGVDQVCYWYTGYSGNMYSSAATLKRAGKQLINTNKDYYYVVSKNQITQWNSPEIQYVFSGPYDEATWINKANQFNRDTFNNWAWINNTSVSSDGSMFCIWCDNPGAKDETQIAKETRMILRVMAARMQNSYDYQGADVLVDGGFDADGRIYHKDIKDNKDIKDIYITVGQKHTETIDGNHPGPYEGIDTSIATVTGNVIPGTTTSPTLGDKYTLYGDSSISTATGVISDGSNNNFLKVSGESLTNTTKIEEATKFTVVKTSTNKATIQVTDTNSYLKLMNTSGSTSSIMAVEESYEWEVGLGSDFCWQAGYNSYYYLAYYGENWTSNDNWAYAGHLYAVEPGTTSTTDKTKLTFTGVKTGNTEVTIGNVTYKVHVSDALADNGDLYVDFWVTSSMITPKDIATTNQNGHIYATYTKEQFSGEDGVLLSDVIPQEGTYQTGTGTSATSHNATYWKTRYLPSECRQKDVVWTNKNGVGTDTLTEGKGGRDVERIRYWEGKWQYLAVNGGEWTTFTTSKDTSGNQMAAYYVIETNVTKEVTTYVTDWSDEQTAKMYGVALDFCVKYPSQDTRVPATFKNTNTQWFNCKGEENSDAYNNGYSVYASDTKVGSWKGMRTSSPSQGDWYRVINHIEVAEDKNYEVYMITATPSTSFNTATSPLTCPENISYTGTERVLWAKNESVVTDSGLTKHSDYKMGGSPVIERVMIQQCSGMLLTYYVRPKAVANPLTVHFREVNAATDFASYQINPQVPGTTFDSDIALPNTPNNIGELTNATIKNDVGVDQKVTSDLRDVPGVPAQYRKTAFKCVSLTRTDDLREITLYYTFDNSVAFVADFGLPLTITPKDVNSDLDANKITGAAVSGGSGLTVDTSNPAAIIVTPNKDFASKTSTSFTLTYTGTGDNAESVTYLVYILPASNVLYEENFLTESSENGRKSWTEFQFTAQQQTQKLKAAQIFGYDTAYANVTSAQGYWTAEGLMTKADSTKSLTTTFYGNAIDVIGSCGPKTGIVMVSIKNAATGKPVKSVVIETTYTAGTIDQVPLAHIELGEGNANYTAVIRGYAPLDAAQQQSGSLMLAADYYGGSYDALTADLAEMGLSLSDVEFIRASGAAAKVASTRRAAQAYALETVADSRNSDNTVTIDGFRVYRSANNEAYKELANEYQVTYSNILKVMEGQVITAYVDNKAVTNCEVSKYEEKGGPQNEIYLQNNQTIAFELQDSNGNAAANQDIQISLSAVSGATQYNTTDISSTMEMYYTLKTNDKGIVTIMNTGDNLLAIGNVKVPAGCITVAPDKIDTQELVRSINLALNAAPETPDEGFDPAISAKVTTTRFIRSKVVTLTVSASSDVAVLEVNGVELRPTNSWLVKIGWSDTYTYILTEKVQKNEIKTYEIVGYRADGAASETIVVKSK